MKYAKPFISIPSQIDILKQRGLIVTDDAYIEKKLSIVSFYRLRAYTYPFQDNSINSHPFIKTVTFEEIFQLYQFDSKLRQLIFSALEEIEIALRTQIIYHFSKSFGSHWQLDPTIYRDTARFAQQIQTLNEEISRSDETFIKHYKSKYTSPSQPPSWMCIEVASIGLLSKIYMNLKKGDEKEAVALYFGLKKYEVLENWMLCFTNLRNICAHHGRLWNRRLTAHPTLPYNTVHEFLSKNDINNIYPNKLYAVVCCIAYSLKSMGSENNFKNQLLTLMQECPLKQEKEMGFSNNWQIHQVWK